MRDLSSPLDGFRSPFWKQPAGTGYSPASLFAGGEAGAFYDLSAVFQETTGAGATTPSTADTLVGTMADSSRNGNYAVASLATTRPFLRVTSGVRRLEDDNVDDVLNVTLSDLGAAATEVIMTTTGITINTAQTIGAGPRDVLTNNMVGYIVINRALTDPETFHVTAYAATKRGA